MQTLRSIRLIFFFVFDVSLLVPSSFAQDSPSGAWFLSSSAPWVQKLSQPQYDIKFEYQVDIPMRDGVKLRANIWRPNAEGRFPVIYVFTPYDNTVWTPEQPMVDDIGRARYFVPRGYVFTAISMRGRYGSEGDPYLFWFKDWQTGKFEGQDVQDCLSWLGTRQWSSGKVGMTGVSYLAMVQWMGAMLGSPYLKAIIPIGSPDDNFHNVNRDGAVSLSVAIWLMVIGERRTNESGIWDHFVDWEKIHRHLPLRTLDEALLGKKSKNWQDFLDHPDNDAYWHVGSPGARYRVGEMTAGKYPLIKVPSLNITGWYDSVLQNTINNYLGMVHYGPEELRDKHRLIVGPWIHNGVHRKVGDLDFGPDAEVELHPIELRWFDYWLKGIDNGILEEPRAHVFVTGRNKWRGEQEWPLLRGKETKYYFHSSGRANSLFGDGSLSITPPSQETNDRFVYDPDDPVPTYGGGVIMKPDVSGPRDRRAIQRRDDVLVYTSSTLSDDTEVTGRILAKLYAASSTPDTDFTGALVDVRPDGYATLLASGNMRARYRNSFQTEELITPGRVYEYTIDLWSISHVFEKGHKIRVEISSSNFPWYDRNPNTGHKKGEDAELQKANQTIYHNNQYASHIILPLVR
jgi:putative CocE/NonD family hydrolase